MLAWQEITGEQIDAIFLAINHMADKEKSLAKELSSLSVKTGNTETGKNHFIRLLGEHTPFLEYREKRAKFIREILLIYSVEVSLGSIKQKLRDIENERL